MTTTARPPMTAPATVRRLTVERLCAWSGPALTAVFAVGFVGIMGWLPAPSPSLTVSQVNAMYAQHRSAILIGSFLLQMSMGMIVPFGVSIAAQCRRIERDRVPAATFLQLSSIAVSVIVVVLVSVFWSSAAFRVGTTSPDVVAGHHDVGWILFLYPWVPFVIWMVSIAVPILQDDRDQPVYPRWAGFLTLWAGFLFIPAGLVTFFTSGPFAWNGAVAFYLPVAVFFVWLIAMSVLTLRAIRRAESEV